MHFFTANLPMKLFKNINRCLPAIIMLLIVTAGCNKTETPGPVEPQDPEFLELPAYIKGCDLAFLPEIRKDGIVFKDLSGAAEDPLATLHKAGMNAVRLRLWHRSGGNYDLFDVGDFSAELRDLKLPVWLTIHYSDTWADPGAQLKPAAWANLDFETLKDSMYQYTFRVAARLQPAMLQIGNEINQGLLWPEGHISNVYQMRALLAEGIRACRTASPKTKIMLHYAGHQNALQFFEPFKNLDFDYIGLSYYPIWHGKSLSSLGGSISSLTEAYGKKVIIAETSYPFSFGWADWTNNVLGDQTQIISDYQASPDGQAAYLNALDETVLQAGGMGWCYWGAEWVASKGAEATNGSSWENQALWDFDFKALPAVNQFFRPIGQ